jgi:hypothetical protein
MADLSPATASIVQAFDDRYELLGGFDDNWQELCIAAALRAAADQVVPVRAWHESDNDAAWERHQMSVIIRRRILAIAAELEAQ